MVVQLDFNWLVSPPQCAMTSINRTADEPGWNLMPLFSLSQTSTSSFSFILFLFFPLPFYIPQGRAKYLPPPWPPPPAPTSQCFPPGQVFQPVPLFYRLILPLIKDDHTPCVSALHLGLFCSPCPSYQGYPRIWFSQLKVWLSYFLFVLSSPQSVSLVSPLRPSGGLF